MSRLLATDAVRCRQCGARRGVAHLADQTVWSARWPGAAARRRGLCALDAFDLGPGVVALHAEIPDVADHRRLERDLGGLHAHATEFGIVDLAPDVAVLQRVFAATAEAAEFALQAAGDRFQRTKVEETAVVVLDLLLGFGRGFGGDGVDLAAEPDVQLRQFLGGQLVQAGGLEFLGRHVLFDGLARQRIGREREGGEQGERQQRAKHGHRSVPQGRTSLV
jgi:hypothetical protein